MRRFCIVKSRLAKHLETYVASDHRYCPNDLVGLFPLDVDRHIIRQFNHAFVGEKSCEKNVGVRQIKLAKTYVCKLGLDLKPSTLFVIKQRGEYCRRIKIRIAEKIN